MIRSPPRPVSVPPTEVASRNPLAVSSISVSESFCPIRVPGTAFSIPGRLDDRAEVVRMFLGQIAGVRDADDAPSRIVSQDEGRKRDRRRYRLQRSRRHVDDQSLDLAAADALELVSDCPKMPGGDEDLSWREGAENLLQKRPEVRAQKRIETPAVKVRRRFLLHRTFKDPLGAGSGRYRARIALSSASKSLRRGAAAVESA